MAHIRHTEPMQIASSDDGWYDVARQVGKGANERARISGTITAVVREGWPYGGKSAPACFIPSKAEMFLDRSILPFGPVDKVDFSDRLWCLTHAPTVGALEHEAAHARHTRWDMPTFRTLGATERMIDVIVTLEEPRIERNAIIRSSAAKPYLRACATEIVAKDFQISDTPYGASVAAGLLLARVDAGVLSHSEVKDPREAIVEVLGEDVLDVLEPLWKRFLRLLDTDYAAMVQIAREWLEALGIDPEDDEDPQDLAGGSMTGDGDGEGEGEGEGEGDEDSLAGKVGKTMRRVAIKADQEAAERAGAERQARAAAERQADRERAEAAKTPHRQAFPSHGVSPGGYAHLVDTRQPSADERNAAVVLGREWSNLHFHDRVVVKRSSIVPPGRLRGRAAVGMAAERAMGIPSTDPALWSSKVRTLVDDTPLTLGLLTDISGSMGSAMEPLASTQWVCSEAGHQIDAKVASVHFGERVHGVLRVGQREPGVRVFEPGDGYESFRDGALALDAEVNLLNGRGARLLVVLSDGHYGKPEHRAYATTFVPLAISKGVTVLWLDFTGSFYSAYGGKRVSVKGKSPSEVALLIGRAAADEMRRVDAGR